MMDLPNAYRVAAHYDFNRDGQINTGYFHREVEFDKNAKRLVDLNKDGKVSLDEFAHGLARGDVFVGYDQKVHSANPFDGPGGSGSAYPYPGGGSPYYPGAGGGGVYHPSYPTQPWGAGGNAYGSIAGGALVGGAIGYISGGKDGASSGAVIGGVIGAISNFFGNR